MQPLESRTKTEKCFSVASEASPSNITAPHRINRIEEVDEEV